MVNALDHDLTRSSGPAYFPNQHQDSPNISAWVSIAVILAVVAAVIVPMALMGIPDGFDKMQHVRFAAVYHDSILNGSLTSGWAANEKEPEFLGAARMLSLFTWIAMSILLAGYCLRFGKNIRGI